VPFGLPSVTPWHLLLRAKKWAVSEWILTLPVKIVQIFKASLYFTRLDRLSLFVCPSPTPWTSLNTFYICVKISFPYTSWKCGGSTFDLLKVIAKVLSKTMLGRKNLRTIFRFQTYRRRRSEKWNGKAISRSVLF